MKKNLYYRTVLRRQNFIKTLLLDFFLSVASYPRLLLEVFIRKNFGERYFSLPAVVVLGILLAFFPWMADKMSFSGRSIFGNGGYGNYGDTSGFWTKYATWYIYLLAFLYFSFLRWKEVKRNPSVFDFARFSLHQGNINQRFYSISLLGVRPNSRIIEILYEPALFLIAGIILKFFNQSLGTLLIISSIFYSLSYYCAYMNGDNFVMDKIDEIILNEEMQNAFVDDKDSDKSRGVKFYARKPTTSELREKVGETFTESDDEGTEAK